MPEQSQLEIVRGVFRREGLDGVWKWCMAPDNPCNKASRFQIAKIFAKIERDHASDVQDREKWAEVRAVYAKQEEKYTLRCEAREVDFKPSLGPPHWGGARDFFDQFIYPIALRMGMSPDYDDKEWGHAAGGDHDPTVLNAFAEDFPTFSGAAFANAVGQALGRQSNTGTYAFIYYKWQGYNWRVQILWAVPDHYNHVHIGARRV
jgi:hypothetical protein